MIDGEIGVITALPDELRPILRRSSGLRAETRRGVRVWRGVLGGKPVALACAGEGNRNAEKALEFFGSDRPSALIGAGVAGGLTDDLAADQIVAGRRMTGPSGETLLPDAELLRRAVSAGATAVSFLTVDRIVCASEERRALARRVSEGPPAAVDLETSFWAAAARDLGVPFLGLRSISDAAGESLPPLLASCQQPGGPVPAATIALRAFYRPALLRALFRLRSRVRTASERLAAALEKLLMAPEIG